MNIRCDLFKNHGIFNDSLKIPTKAMKAVAMSNHVYFYHKSLYNTKTARTIPTSIVDQIIKTTAADLNAEPQTPCWIADAA